MICATSVRTSAPKASGVSTQVELIQEKIIARERISPDDALQLARSLSLPELGALADAVRERKHPHRVVTYIIDRNINYTNICNVYCTFCAFMREERDEDSYVLAPEQVGEKINTAGHFGTGISAADIDRIVKTFRY